jgi:hypothetical protein
MLGLAALAGAGSSVLTNPIWLVKVLRKKSEFFSFMVFLAVEIAVSAA